MRLFVLVPYLYVSQPNNEVDERRRVTSLVPRPVRGVSSLRLHGRSCGFERLREELPDAPTDGLMQHPNNAAIHQRLLGLHHLLGRWPQRLLLLLALLLLLRQLLLMAL